MFCFLLYFFRIQQFHKKLNCSFYIAIEGNISSEQMRKVFVCSNGLFDLIGYYYFT